MRALTPEQQEKAIIGTNVPRDVITTAQVDNLELPITSICYDALTAPQRALMRKLSPSMSGAFVPIMKESAWPK
jgi:hypothetical protein